MHELSIAYNLIETASKIAKDEGSEQVTRLNIRVGLLSGVVQDALLFSFQVAAEGTPCAGAELVVEEVSVRVRCPKCDQAKLLTDRYRFICPTCGTPTPQILSGQELDLVSMEIESQEVAADDAART